MSRVLLSAYACEPGKGSEPEVGWRWALELARLGHEVTVLTRANNRAALEAALPATGLAERVCLATYDLPRWASSWKRGRRGVRLYYLLWQWRAARLAERLHRAHRFDRVHHATFVSLRQPSFLGRLGAPFVFGPVSGGEAIPWRLRGGRGLRAFCIEALRDLANALVRVDPLMARTFAAAETIVVTSKSSHALVPRRFRAKTRLSLAIGIDPEAWTAASPRAGGGPLRLLFVGRLVGFKALDLALEAIAAARAGGTDLRFTVVGDGPLARRWRADGIRLGLDDVVTWLPWRPRAELAGAYATHDALLFPSLRDSGGIVVLEALASGLPVVALDLGGPGQLVDETCGIRVATARRGRAAVVADLAVALTRLARDPDIRMRLGSAAPARARCFTWSGLVRGLYDPAEPSPSP
ncbi:MAG: glycosyltransferase family 4 protein [Alphaproteobacteria bacterium]